MYDVELKSLSKTLSDIPKLNIDPSIFKSLAPLTKRMEEMTRPIQIPMQIPMPIIDPKSTVAYKMDIQNELMNEQLKQMEQHNQLLNKNYNQLKDLYDIQRQEYENAKKELGKSKGYNTIMLIVAIVSALVGLASAIVTLVVAI